MLSWEAARYYMAVLVALSVPPMLLAWIVIHSAPRFWRRRGPLATYLIVATLTVGLAIWLYSRRLSLLGEPLGFHWGLAAFGLGLYGVAIGLEVLCRRHLKLQTLVGLPEIGTDAGRLLEDGIYGRIRHPRYLSFMFGVAGWALIVNYRGLYVYLLACLPLVYLVVVLEERELGQRFGEDYAAYSRRVPRFIPGRRPH